MWRRETEIIATSLTIGRFVNQWKRNAKKKRERERCREVHGMAGMWEAPRKWQCF